MIKNPFPLFVIFLSLAACQSSQDTKHADSPEITSNTSTDFKKLDTAISFAGFWVNERYVESIKKLKSPTKADIPNLSCFTIPERTLQSTGIVYGFHEGGEGLRVVKHGSQYEIWNDSLTNKRFEIIQIASNKLQIGEDRFVKLGNPSISSDNLRIVEELLFKGRFMNNGTAVEFTTDGQVRGLSNFNRYDVWFDYAAESDRVDIIQFGETKDNLKDYGFKFRNDSLLIFELKCADSANNGDCYEKDYDKLKYVLVKTTVQ